jgi:hypothetical protein
LSIRNFLSRIFGVGGSLPPAASDVPAPPARDLPAPPQELARQLTASMLTELESRKFGDSGTYSLNFIDGSAMIVFAWGYSGTNVSNLKRLMESYTRAEGAGVNS